VGPVERRNLATIANLITHLAAPSFEVVTNFFVQKPLQEYIRSDGVLFKDFILDGQ